MSEKARTSENIPDTSHPPFHPRPVRATRAPTPQACGCGLPVAFDPEKQEFFCIGCGASRVCTCGRSLFGSAARPVNVV